MSFIEAFFCQVRFVRHCYRYKDLSKIDTLIKTIVTSTMFTQFKNRLLLLYICSSCFAFSHVGHSHNLMSRVVRDLPAADTAETIASISSAQSSILAELQDECSLWNNSCSGNRGQALSKFFGNTGVGLSHDACFHDSSNCSAAIQRVYGQVKEWMKSPQCGSSQNEWEKGVRDPIDHCCLKCDLEVGKVDIYYWPDPVADTSCLSVVGNSVNPVEYGATTVPVSGGASLTVWVCTTKIQDSVMSTITTAMLTSQLGLTFKQQSYNPWSLLSCTEDYGSSPVSTDASAICSARASLRARGPLRARGRPLTASPSLEKKNDALVTVTSGTFTL